MNIKELKEIVPHYAVDEMWVNPMAVIKDVEFNKSGPDYRERSVNYALNLKIDFDSEINTLDTLFNKLVVVKCPHCKKQMNTKGYSGCSDAQSMVYECKKCKMHLFIRLHADSIRVEYEKNRRNK